MSKLNWSTSIPSEELTKSNKQLLGLHENGAPWIYFSRDIASAIKNGFSWKWVSSEELVNDSKDTSAPILNNKELDEKIKKQDTEILKLKTELEDLKKNIRNLID